MHTFDLDKAIVAWRRSLRLNRSFLGEDLEELESHLRDHIDRQVKDGLEPERAFKSALHRLGNYGELEQEYDKVRYGLSKRRLTVMRDSVWTLALLNNYLTVALRTLRRQRFYSALNIGGLAIGLAACLLIGAYVGHELSYDGFHERSSEIYRVNWDYSWNGSSGVSSGSPPPLAAALSNNIPGIRETTRVYSVPDMVVRQDDRVFSESGILAVDSTFFDLFSFELLEGNRQALLSAPGSVILTEQTARKYFGQEPALGQSIQIGDDNTGFTGSYASSFQVTGIMENPPANSHIQFDLLTSMSSYSQVTYFDWSWIWMQMVTYVIVEDPAVIPSMEAQVVSLVGELAPASFTRVGFSFEELLEAGGYWNFDFQPLSDIHLGSENIGNRLGQTGSRTNLMIFVIVALFILAIACINAMNLATARSTNRANEVGVRKVLGSDRSSLVGQFMMESVLFSGLAMALALTLAWSLLGPFNQVAHKSLDFGALGAGWVPLGLVGIVLVVGILVGSYPSFYLSAFRPAQVLKGAIVVGRNGNRFRNSLVVLQFSISIALIICTLLVRDQMLFFQETDLGFDEDRVVVISNENNRLGDRTDVFKENIEGQALVAGVSLTTSIPSGNAFQDYYKIEGLGDEQWDLASYLVDEAFVATLGMDIILGHDFPLDSPSNATSVILNEQAVRQFGWEHPLGKVITYPSAGDFTVVGVLRDFNYESLSVPIRPFALFHRSSESYTIPDAKIAIRLQSERPGDAIAMLEREWLALAPDAPFEYAFLDDSIAAQYSTQAALENLFMIFAGLAIIIACLGLWGMAAFTAERRTKEIGIRKSLGASVPSVSALLILDFTKWVLLANVLAWPIAWIWADRWLDTFAFRVDVGVEPFLVASGAALLIAVLTVSYQAARTARANPVEALRAQ